MASKKRGPITWIRGSRRVDEIIPNSGNPRCITKHDQDHLRKSLEIFGMCQPLVLNTDGMIIGGHQRYQVLCKMKVPEVDCYIPNRFLEKEEVAELTIRLNRNQGDWDYEMLANGYSPDDLVDFGFTIEDLHLEEIPGSDPSEEEGKKLRATMTITFLDNEHLQEAENRISTIVDEFPGATYKVRVL